MYYSDIDIKDVEEIPTPENISGCTSDFFLDTFPEVFPGIYRQELFGFFHYLIHPYRRCFDTPASSPRNEEIESAIRSRGKTGACTFQRESGRFVVKPIMDWMFDARRERRKHYYTSDTRAALLMFDVDGHKAYQSREITLAARRIVEEAFRAVLEVAPSFAASDRGENGYSLVKLRREKPDDANRVFRDLEEAIRNLLAAHGNLADFEVKGTVSWTDDRGTFHAGVYGKLPTCSPDWSYKWFDQFRRTRMLTLNDLKRVIDRIKAQVTDADHHKFDRLKHDAILAHYLPVPADQRWRLTAELNNAWEDSTLKYLGREWVAKCSLTDALIDRLAKADLLKLPVPVTDVGVSVEVAPGEIARQVFLELGGPKEKRVPKKERHVRRAAGKKSSAPLSSPHEEPDSYKRQFQALLVFARAIGRIPSVDEALAHILENHLFTGSWTDNETKRANRVASILKTIAKSFDPAKCKKRTASSDNLRAWAAANVHKYDVWAKANYPNGIEYLRKHHVGEDGVSHEEWTQVSTSLISVFLAVCEFALVVDKNDDDSFPESRAKAIWGALAEKVPEAGKFCPRKWAACRETFHQAGIVDVFDRSYRHGKAMKWRIGGSFQRLVVTEVRRETSILDPESITKFAEMVRKREKEELNPLLRLEEEWFGDVKEKKERKEELNPLLRQQW